MNNWKNLTNLEISLLSQEEWKKIKNNFLNTSPNFNFEVRFDMILKIKKILEEAKIKIFLANGTLLGAVRENNFIPWDPDVDLDVFYEDLLPNFISIKEKLINLGFIVRTVENFPEMKINCYYNGEKVGILALYLKKNIRFRSSYKWPKELYEKQEKIIFKGTEFSCPNIKEYLLHQYGADWHIPLKKDYFSKDLFR